MWTHKVNLIVHVDIDDVIVVTCLEPEIERKIIIIIIIMKNNSLKLLNKLKRLLTACPKLCFKQVRYTHSSVLTRNF